jgi:hypothetical protein
MGLLGPDCKASRSIEPPIGREDSRAQALCCGEAIAPQKGEFETECLCHPRDGDALRVRRGATTTSNVCFGSKAAITLAAGMGGKLPLRQTLIKSPLPRGDALQNMF